MTPLFNFNCRGRFLAELEKCGFYRTCDFIVALDSWSSPKNGRQQLCPRDYLTVTDAELFAGMVILKAERRRGKPCKPVDKDKLAAVFAAADSCSVFAVYDGGDRVRKVYETYGAGTPIDTFYFRAFVKLKDELDAFIGSASMLTPGAFF